MHELLAVIKKELQQLLRDRKVIPAMVLGPIIQLLDLGRLAREDVEPGTGRPSPVPL